MAFETGTASSMADFVASIDTFLVAEGWTQDEATPASGIYSWTLGLLNVSVRWDVVTSSPSPEHLALYQALGYRRGVKRVAINAAGTGYAVDDILTVAGGTSTTAATIRVTSVDSGASDAIDGAVLETAGSNYTADPTTTGNSVTGGTGSSATFDLTMSGTVSGVPGQFCGDCGSGVVSALDSSLDETRSLYEIGDGPYPSYHFFTNETGVNYFYCALQYSSGLYRHLAFGNIEKKGDWVGGEFVCGHTHTNASPTSSSNCVLLDGRWNQSSGSQENRAPTMRVEGLQSYGQVTDGQWGECNGDATLGNLKVATDRDGTARTQLLGGFKANMFAPLFGWVRSNVANGFVPMYPIAVWFVSTSPSTIRLLGFMKDVRGINIAAFTAGEEVTIGSDVWVVFPAVRKQNTAVTDESRNQGIAYLKRT